VREIHGHLAEIYGAEVSPDLISQSTDAVLEDVKAWQAWPLENVYAIVYLDCLTVKIRERPGGAQPRLLLGDRHQPRRRARRARDLV
jgi:transposase-like protein